MDGDDRIITVDAADTRDEQGAWRIWPLHIDRRPVDDLSTLARLLSGCTISPFGQLSQDQAEPIQKVWQGLRQEYPATFSASDDDARRWHQYMAEQGEIDRDRFSRRST